MTRYKTLDFLNFPKYRVGDDGSFWSYRMDRNGRYRWKLLKGGHVGRYRRVKLCHESVQKSELLHRLILMAFVGPSPTHKPCGCHNDGDPSNNNLSNLRWDSPAGNMRDKLKHGTSQRGISINQGELQGSSVLTTAQVLEIRERYVKGKIGYKSLGNQYGVSCWTIRSIIKRINWKHV